MARRSTVQQGPRIAGDPELSAYPDSPDFDPPPPRKRRGRWSGGGGRWLVWTGRAILWALIVVIVVNGIRAPFERFTQSNEPAANGVTPSGAGFPVDRGSAFAAQFAGVYLSFDAANPQSRATKLAPYLPEDADDQFGWDGYGAMGAVAIQPYDAEVIDSQNAIVTVAFQSSGRRLLLSVPLYFKGDRFVVSGRPALLPAPGPADLPMLAEPETDDAVTNELRPQLADFFKAYGEGDTVALQRYVADGKSMPNFGGAFTFAELKKIVVPVGGSTREIQVVVVWGVPSGATPSAQPTASDVSAVNGRLEQAYRLTVEKQGARWYVVDIRGAGRAVG